MPECLRPPGKSGRRWHRGSTDSPKSNESVTLVRGRACPEGVITSLEGSVTAGIRSLSASALGLCDEKTFSKTCETTSLKG
jgi:hypothetical protein